MQSRRRENGLGDEESDDVDGEEAAAEENPFSNSENAASAESTGEDESEASADSPARPDADDATEPADPDDGKNVDPYIPRGGNPKSPLRVGGFGSEHPGCAIFALADGSVRTISEDASKRFLQSMADRKDGKIVEDQY